MRIRFLLLCFFAAAQGRAEILPGFRIEKIGAASGFLTSLIEGPGGVLLYSVTGGEIYRMSAGESTLVAKVDTANEGNAVLLGIALLDPFTLVAHYVTPDFTADVVSTVSLTNGEVVELAKFPCDAKGAPCSTEHHGGNPIVAPDGSIYVAIGDYGVGLPAQNLSSPGGKIFRITRDGTVTMHSLGYRNVFDFQFDPRSGKLIVGDNGATGQDEINLVSQGDNCGWPFTAGTQEVTPGTIGPVYTYPKTAAPTGVAYIKGTGRLAERGLLVATFVPRGLSYFPSIDTQPFPEPVEILSRETLPLIDVIETSSGEILFADFKSIFRLMFPRPGDANGDGIVNDEDFDALARELVDGDGTSTVRTQEGLYRGSWGADANGDGRVDTSDLIALANLLTKRTRPVRAGKG